MKRITIILAVVLITIANITKAQLTATEIQARKEFLSLDIPVTIVLKSNGLVGNPSQPKARLEVTIMTFDVGQVENSGRYYVITKNSNGTESRTYLGYLTGNVYMNNTVFTDSNTKPTKYMYWQINKNLGLYSVDIPKSILGY